jgi:hypothetical protein
MGILLVRLDILRHSYAFITISYHFIHGRIIHSFHASSHTCIISQQLDDNVNRVAQAQHGEMQTLQSRLTKAQIELQKPIDAGYRCSIHSIQVQHT